MEQVYAQALWEMIAEGKQPAAAVKALHRALEARGRAALMPRIARAFERIAQRHSSREGITLTVAREKDERHAVQEAKAALEKLGVERKEIEVRIDESLIGGWRLEGRGQLIDASFKKYLLDMYNRATA